MTNNAVSSFSYNLIDRLEWINEQFSKSKFCRKINSGGYGIVVYYMFIFLSNLKQIVEAKSSNIFDFPIKNIKLEVAINNSEQLFYLDDYKSIKIKYNKKNDFVDLFQQIHSFDWHHLLISFNYQNKRYYFDAFNLYCRTKNKSSYSFHKNPDNHFLFLKHNVNIDLLKQMISIDKNNKSKSCCAYDFNSAFLYKKRMTIHDVHREIIEIIATGLLTI